MFSEKSVARWRDGLLCVLLAALAVTLFLKYLFAPLLPFLLAYAFASVLQPVIRFAGARLKVPRKLTVLVCVLVFAGLVGGGIWLLGRRLYAEGVSFAGAAEEFLVRLRDDPDFAGQVIDKIDSFVPFFDVKKPLTTFVSGLDGKLSSLVSGLAGRFSGTLLPMLASAAAFLPEAVLFLTVFLLASYYFAADYPRVHASLRGLLPPDVAKKVEKMRASIGSSLGSFVRAYGLLMLLTFSELFSALLILRYRYAFLIALGTAFIDILPVLGTGTVLIPWGVITLLSGDTVRGAALLCVYAGMTVVRQILEPRVVGKYIGLSPLATLAAMYLGLRLFGLAGLLFLPLCALAIRKK